LEEQLKGEVDELMRLAEQADNAPLPEQLDIPLELQRRECQWPPELIHFRPRKLTHPEIRISVSFRFSASVDSFLLRA
jgi:hypothetical protein